MTQHRSFKRLVRARMARTGESYTTARARLLAAAPDRHPAPDEQGERRRAVLATSEETIRARTGRGWEEWFDLLDDAGMRERPHREVARWLASEEDLHPLAWAVQAVVGSYERARGGREVGQHADGFAVHVSRTVGAPVARALEAVADEGLRAGWLADLVLLPRPSRSSRVAHFDVPDGGGRVHVVVDAKGEGRTTVTVEHGRLADAATADEARAAWRKRLDALRALLEGGAR